MSKATPPNATRDVRHRTSEAPGYGARTLCGLVFTCLFALLTAPAHADEKTPEQLANVILKDRIARCLRVGLARPDDDVFLIELEANLYEAALHTRDKKVKALLAIEALRSMPHFVKPGEQPLSEAEREERFRKSPDYAKLKAWYLQLFREDQNKRPNQPDAGDGK